MSTTICRDCQHFQEKDFIQDGQDFHGRCTESRVRRPEGQQDNELPRTKRHYWCAYFDYKK